MANLGLGYLFNLHQRIILLKKQYLVSPASYGDLDLSVLELDSLLVEAETLLELFRRDGFSITRDEARQFMITLEQQFVRVHSHAMVSLADPELRAVFADLARYDRAHLAMLTEL